MELPPQNLVRESLLKYHTCLQDHMDELLAWVCHCSFVGIPGTTIFAEGEEDQHRCRVPTLPADGAGERVLAGSDDPCVASGWQHAHGDGSGKGHRE